MKDKYQRLLDKLTLRPSMIRLPKLMTDDELEKLWEAGDDGFIDALRRIETETLKRVEKINQ